ncbi:MAG: hypothetical protein K9N34_10805 [Candidatus Marinimicrobia bacterium]|nr:hypothetical protein [Candidatus Neomarinimicrobiota bacterium]
MILLLLKDDLFNFLRFNTGKKNLEMGTETPHQARFIPGRNTPKLMDQVKGALVASRVRHDRLGAGVKSQMGAL